LIGLYTFSSCGGGPGFSDIPEITSISVSKDTMTQGFNQDSILLTIGFRDGDGDLGSKPGEVNRNIFLTDSRTENEYGRYKIPQLDIAGAQSGIEGEITMKVFTTCCIFPPMDSIVPCTESLVYPTNELSLDVMLVDDSGNESNIVTSSLLTILCN